MSKIYSDGLGTDEATGTEHVLIFNHDFNQTVENSNKGTHHMGGDI